MGERLLARIIDGGIVVLAAILLGGVLGGFLAAAGADSDAAVGVGALVGYASAFVGGFFYHVAMLATRGQTVGKRTMGLIVIPTPNIALYAHGAPDPSHLKIPMGWGKAFGREGSYFGAGALTCGIGGILIALSPLFDGPGRRGWHDKLAGVVVIQA